MRAVFIASASIAARLGETALGAHQVALQVWMFLAFVLDALAIAAQALVANLLGADDVPTARSASRRMLAHGVIVSIPLGVATVVTASWTASLFTTDEVVIRAARDVLLVVGAMQPICALAFVLDGVMIASGDIRFLLVAVVVATLAFAASVAVVSPLSSVVGLWGLVTVFMTVRTLPLAIRFMNDRWLRRGRDRAQLALELPEIVD